MVRVFLLLIVLELLGGCVSDERILSQSSDHDPVPGEATPAPQPGPRGGWAW